jgi:hypothetical protein
MELTAPEAVVVVVDLRIQSGLIAVDQEVPVL